MLFHLERPRTALAAVAMFFALAVTARGDVAPPYPQVSKGWEAAQALLTRMSQVYDVRPPRLLKDQSSAYRDGTIFIRSEALDGEIMEAVLAHEFAHYLYGHSGFFPAHELEADSKVVEILQRSRGYSRGEAFRVQLRRMRLIHRLNLPLNGHLPPCQELRAFLTGYPEFREFVLRSGNEQERSCLPSGW
jgi:hypothetical protein